MRRPTSLLAAALCLLLPLAPAAAQDGGDDGPPELDEGLLAGLSFRNLGPALMSGRIIDIAVDPTAHSTWYVAAASGGVWKTENAGNTWTPIFDDQGSYSIGTVTVDPKRPLTVWVGTGEDNSQRSVGYGDGVYKSTDGGRTWENTGLGDSEHIGEILVDPRDSETVWVAAHGPLWNAGGDRGLYRTTDGGESWELMLEIGPHTGVSEVHMDPRDPDVMYAVAYQRRRHVWTLINGGPNSGLYKTTDGGETWTELERGLPDTHIGRIGMAIEPNDPDVLYAIVEAADGESGFYRSQDAGSHWTKVSDYVSTSPQYYNEIIADPHRMGRVYSNDTYFHVTEDGGETWERVPGYENKHVDHHALWIDPEDEDHLVAGNDGGVYETFDRGQNWDFFANLPITQFYKITVGYRDPFYYVYGGTQDNNTQGGPTQTTSVHGIRNSDWFVTIFGDGYDPEVDPTDPNVIYSQWQYGNLVRYDHQSGEVVDIKPQEDPDGPPFRFNWNSPLELSPHSPTRLYYGSQFLHRSEDRGESWERISPDLTRQIDRNELEVMGRVWSVDAVAKNVSTSDYGAIVALDESALVEGLLYVGTDDGLIQVSEDGGESWRAVTSLPAVNDTAYVSDIEASRTDPDVVYATVDDHKRGDFAPYVFRSSDRGRSWSLISEGLPDRGSAYALAVDDEVPGLIFVGTEFGVHFTPDDGESWYELDAGMPTIAVRDLEIQREEDDLVAGTFGRGIRVLDDYSPLRALARREGEILASEAHVFEPDTAVMYLRRAELGGGEKASQGDAFYTAENPPYGAVFTWYLRDDLETRREMRREREREMAEEGEDVRYPPWDTLRAEDREVEPKAWLVIRDTDGDVVRRVEAPTSSGIHRTAWDFRYPSPRPAGQEDGGFFGTSGPLAVPGDYTVSVVKRIRGETTELVAPTPFRVTPIGMHSLEPTDRDSLLAFQRRVGDLQRAAMGAEEVLQEVRDRIEKMRDALQRAPEADMALMDDIRAIQLEALEIRDVLEGDPTRARRDEPSMPGILDRIQRVAFGSFNNTQAPTGTQFRSLEIAENEYDRVSDRLRQLVEEDLAALEEELEAAGAPWTPGQGVPDWPPE